MPKDFEMGSDSNNLVYAWDQPHVRDSVARQINLFLQAYGGMKQCNKIGQQLKEKLHNIETYVDPNSPDPDEIKKSLPEDISAVEKIIHSKQAKNEISDRHTRRAAIMLVEELRSLTPPTLLYTTRRKNMLNTEPPINSANFMLDSSAVTEDESSLRCNFLGCMLS